jgi:hypothetical protein
VCTFKVVGNYLKYVLEYNNTQYNLQCFTCTYSENKKGVLEYVRVPYSEFCVQDDKGRQQKAFDVVGRRVEHLYLPVLVHVLATAL